MRLRSPLIHQNAHRGFSRLSDTADHSKSHKAEWLAQNESLGRKQSMRLSSYLLVLALLTLLGCAEEPTTVTTTTTTREVTTTGPVPREVLVTQAPPPVRVEMQTVSPGPVYVWTSGYWRWSGSNYLWVPGSWVMPPRPGVVWVIGHWSRRSRGWVWIPGHWQ